MAWCLVLPVWTGPSAGAEPTGAEGSNPVRGVIRAKMQASISSDLAVAVRSTPILDGERFRKGDLIVAFDCRRYEAEHESARAVHAEAQLMSQNSAFLHGRNALGKLELDIARAREAKAAADLGAIRVRLDQCSVVAPYDGRVVEILVREYETPAPGNPVLSILSDGVLEIEIIVPSSWLAWIKTGTAFEFAIDETGTRHDAVIERLGAAVDPVSQTIKIVGRLAQHDARILPGMSGTARFDEGIAAR